MSKLKGLIVLFIAVGILLSLPKAFSTSLQQKTAHLFSPLWSLFARSSNPSLEEKLLLENALLKNEIAYLKEVILQEVFLDQEIEALLSPLLEKRKQALEKLLEHELLAMPAKVVYRPPVSWSNMLWIQMGEEDHIAKGSPVVRGKGVVGVVEEVGPRLSRVRLLTDATLCPSVRILRKEGQEEIFLAKGYLQGSVTPLWRSSGKVLKGVGFNYDFEDEEGPRRDLRTGKAEGFSSPPLLLAKEGDLLVTTGMDGIFPPGLHVGVVSSVYPIQDADYTITLEAIPAIGNFDDLTHVFVLPPLTN